jgi:hypothetical protein
VAWTYRVGRRPHSVVVVERLDRHGALQLRYTDATGRHTPFLRAPHPQTVRGEDRRGRPCIDAAAEARVQQLAATVYAALVAGENPAVLIDPPASVAVSATMSPEQLTLRALVEVATPATASVRAPTGEREATVASRRGVYGADTPDAREFRQLALRGSAALERVLRGRGVPPLCTELQHSDWVEAGRLLLDEFRSSRPNRAGGVRTVERALGAVIRCGNWAASAGGVPLGAFNAPKPGWRRELTKHVQRTRPTPLVPRVQLHDRLSEDQAGRLLALAFDLSAELDPRFRLAIVLGFPLRLGQVARRVWRSCVTLDTIGAFGAGRVFVPESGNKPAAGFDLHPDERAVLEAMLAGPLSALEAAYARGTIRDYPLMPAGRMRHGVVPPAAGQDLACVSSRRLLECYTQAEAWVGIPHVPSRSWYGLRRTCTDAGSAVTTDSDVRDMMAGWALQGTRGTIYRDARDPRLLADVGRARAALRALLVGAAPTPAVHLTRPKPALTSRDSAAARAQYAAAAEARAAQPGRHRRRLTATGVRKSARVEGPSRAMRNPGDE